MTTGRTRSFLARIGFSVAFAVLSHSVACAGAWPERPVKIIVPFAAGGAADVVTRIVAARISENLGKNFLVENRTGANGVIGVEAVAKAAADGYTVLAGSPGTLAINPHM